MFKKSLDQTLNVKGKCRNNKVCVRFSWPHKSGSMDMFSHTDINAHMRTHTHTHTHTHIVFLGQTVHNSNAKEDLAIPGESAIVWL